MLCFCLANLVCNFFTASLSGVNLLFLYEIKAHVASLQSSSFMIICRIENPTLVGVGGEARYTKIHLK